MHQDSGGAVGGGGVEAPGGEDPTAPARGGAAPEGKDAGEGNSTRSDDAAEEKDTHARDDVLGAKMEGEGFDSNTTPCGPHGWSALGLPSAGRVRSTTLWP